MENFIWFSFYHILLILLEIILFNSLELLFCFTQSKREPPSPARRAIPLNCVYHPLPRELQKRSHQELQRISCPSFNWSNAKCNKQASFNTITGRCKNWKNTFNQTKLIGQTFEFIIPARHLAVLTRSHDFWWCEHVNNRLDHENSISFIYIPNGIPL